MLASRYNILVPLTQGRILAYNSLRGGLAIWSTTEHDYYERVVANDPSIDLEHSIADDLVAGGYLVHDTTDELLIIEEQYKAHRFDARTMMLTIAPTLACNFGCDYCFQGQQKPTDAMGPEVQDAVLALIEASAPGIDRLSIAWYGGEPLIRKQLIYGLSDRIIALCAAKQLRYSATMVTNGYMLDADTARALYQRYVRSIQVTLDGIPVYHDQRRHLLGGQGTFRRIAKNLQAVVEAVPELGLSIRVNIDSRNQDDILGLVDYMDELGLGGRPNLKMYFAPVEAITEGCHKVQDVCMKKASYGQLETALYRHAYDKGLSVLPYPGRFHGTCGAVRPKGYVIVPNGDIHKCWDTVSHPSKAIGSLFDMDAVANHPVAQRWNSWTPFDNNSCRNCRLLPNCAGACAYKFMYAGETRGEAAILPCPSWKYNIKERLLLRAEKMGAITSDDYDQELTRTDPTELCADVYIEGGAELPEPMQAAYAASYTDSSGSRHLPILLP